MYDESLVLDGKAASVAQEDPVVVQNATPRVFRRRLKDRALLSNATIDIEPYSTDKYRM